MPGESQELEFPLYGLDVSTAASEAPPLTAAVAVNVRRQDVFRDRERGGSRSGLTPWINDRPGGLNTPNQHLATVVHYSFEALLTQAEQDGETQAPGGLVVDTMSSNFNARTPASPPAPYPRYRPDKGSGVQPNRSVGPRVNPVPPPPPPPPGPVTRTYFPFAGLEGGEALPRFSVGPFILPLTPPTDLSPTIIVAGADPCGADMLNDLASWSGTDLPSVAEVNALVLSHGCTYGGHPGGPYETSTDA